MTMEEAAGRAAILAEARSWLGTPYHSCARVKGVGVDCGMLIAEVYERAGIIPRMDIAPYAADHHMHRPDEQYIAYILKHGREIETGSLKPGDLALWRFGRSYSHGAIVVDWPVVIHATRKEGRVWECNISDYSLYATRKPLFFSFWG
jgi:cell wall-associated NlpC family hydrolase